MIMLRERQNEHTRAFGMLAARTRVIRVAKMFGDSVIIVHSHLRRTGIFIDAPRSGNIRQLHLDKTFNSLSAISGF